MSSQHTPGPWRIRRFDESQTLIMPESPDGRHTLIAVVSIGRHHPDGEANVALIRAAPELLAACKSLASYVYATTNPAGAPDGLRAANAAIAKAEGRDDE